MSRRRRDGERGLVLPMVGLTLVVLIIFTSFAIDLGYQRIGRRDMQALADVVALDLARMVDGRTVTQIRTDPLWSSGLTQSVARNTSSVGTAPVVTERLGQLNTSTGVFTEVFGATVPDAVEVTAQTDVTYFFRGGTGHASRSAVAASDALACFRLGSFALAVNSGNSAVLNGLIGDALNLGVLGYSGLATSNIVLGDLATQMGVGTVDQLVALDNVSLRDFYLATAQVMQRNGDTANATLLQSIALSVATTAHVDMSDLMNIDTGGGSALSGGVNVLDLVAGSAFVSNGNSALAIPNLAVNLGLSNFSSSINIIEAPRLGCGRVNQATSHSDQLTVAVNGNLASVNNILNTLTATSSVDLDLSIAQATGILRQIVCGDAVAVSDPEGINVDVLTALTALTLRMPTHISGTVAANVLGLGIGLISVNIDLVTTAGTTAPTNSTTAVIRIPPNTYTAPVGTGGGSVGLSGLTVSSTTTSVTATLLGIPLSLANTNALVNLITADLLSKVVNPFISLLDSLLLGPLTDLLGLNVAGADVFGVPRPNCLSPVLRG